MKGVDFLLGYFLEFHYSELFVQTADLSQYHVNLSFIHSLYFLIHLFINNLLPSLQQLHKVIHLIILPNQILKKVQRVWVLNYTIQLLN